MRTRSTKEDFVKFCNKRIEMFGELKAFYADVFLPTLEKFDGKVYNIRFIKALREGAEKISDRYYVYELNNGTIEVDVKTLRFSYVDKETLYIHLLLTDEGRISVELVKNDSLHEAWLGNLDKNIEEYKNSIKNYDKYFKKAEELDKMVKEYNELPFPFRRNMETDYMRIY